MLKEAERRKTKRLKRIHLIADKVKVAELNNISTYGIISKHVKEGEKAFPDIYEWTIQNELRRRKKRREAPSPDPISENDYHISSKNTTMSNNIPATNTTNVPSNTPMNNGWFGSEFEMVTDPNKDKQYRQVPSYRKRKNQGGRPKGSTKNKKLQLKRATIAAMNRLVRIFLIQCHLIFRLMRCSSLKRIMMIRGMKHYQIKIYVKLRMTQLLHCLL